MSSQTPSTQIRAAVREEAQAITDLINVAFRGAEQFFIDEDRISLSTTLELFESGEFLVAFYRDVMVGSVYLEPRGDHTYLGLLSVDPSSQQSGLGSQLVTAAEAHARAQQSRFIDILIVNVREELPDFYRRRGYIETGTSPFPPEVQTKVPCHFINMSKSLVD